MSSNATDSNNAEIFSLRIVSIDNYMRAPVLGLDTCYSEFRADAVKQVPVIRVFGSDSNGVKTCAHIHNVFPYLYVPYAGGDSANEVDRLTYQLATSLDKAINISLGQTNSATQHVFKIVLTKAKPFYGYHKTEHQFLKIFLYNPAFIRRAANLLQNGVILGKIYQPHESHVPYILQFMIDFNLYGMSFLYTPLKLVRYRQSSEQTPCDNSSQTDDFANDDVLKHVDPSQILERNIERMSTSKQEVDLNAATILNRFQVAMNDTESEYANPGIAFLWSDERSRRSKLQQDPPCVTKTQDRGKLPSTDSENFHQAALNRRLEQLAALAADDSTTQSSDHSRMLDQTIVNRKFDLNQFLQNSVYPIECTQTDDRSSHQSNSQSILDASFIIDHTHNGRTSAMSSRLGSTDSPSVNSGSQQFDPNETFVDEDLILSLTQRSLNRTLTNETFNENEHEVLDIFEQMELDEAEEEASTLDETMRIDDDSTLAPLSQRSGERAFSSQKSDLKNEITAFEEEDSDDDLLNQFSMSIIDFLPDEAPEEFKIPQLDGAFNSPKKQPLQRGKLKANTRSPPKSSKKYAPLDIVITKSPAIQRDPVSVDQQKFQIKVPKIYLEKCDSNISKNVPTIQPQPTVALNNNTVDDSSVQNNNCIDLTDEETKTDDSPKQSSEFKVPEKYEHILLRPGFVKLIKYENIEKQFKPSESQTPNKRQSPIYNNDDSDDESYESALESPSKQSLSSSSPLPPRRYPMRERKPRADLQSILTNKPIGATKRKKSSSENDDDLERLDALYSWYKWSNCKLAERYDKERKFFPQPGPSNLNYYEHDDIVGYYRPVSDGKPKKKGPVRSNGSASKKATADKKTPPKTRGRKRNDAEALSPIPNEFKFSDDNSDWEDDIHVQSFYEQSFAENLNIMNSPVVHENSPTPNHVDWNGSATKTPEETADSFLDTTIATPVLTKLMESLKAVASNELNDDDDDGDDHRSMTKQPIQIIGQCKITPLETTPNHSDVMDALEAHKLPKIIHPIPHYSDPNDILADNHSKKEIGHTILQLHGNAINDCEEFQSELNVNGLAKWQRHIALPNGLPRTRNNTNSSKAVVESAGKCRKFFAREKLMKIKPNEMPPMHAQAVQWLKERTANKMKKRPSTEIGDKCAANPAKVQRQNSICNTGNLNQINSNDAEDKPNTNGSHEKSIVSKLLTKSELTVTRITRSNANQKSAISQISNTNHVQIMNTNSKAANQHDADADADDDDDDVICLSDNLPTKQPITNSFCQSQQAIDQSSFRISDDTLAKLNSSETSFGIRGGPLENSFGFRLNLENFQCAKSNIEHNYLTILSLELHCQTRHGHLPDPAYDEIVCIFYELYNDVPAADETTSNNSMLMPQQASGILLNDTRQSYGGIDRLPCKTITRVNSEADLLMELVKLIRKWDPDIFAGYEIEMASWGYIIQRSQAIKFDLVPLISRIPSQRIAKFKPSDDDNHSQQLNDEFIGFEYDSEYKLHGRILLDVWRLLRSEIALTSYSFENIMYHVMHRRCPLYSHEKLTNLWSDSKTKWIVVEYYLDRVKGTLEILNQLDLIGRTCELAKLFGIQFYEVLSRGSQFRVESMMLRIAKPKNLVPISPSVQQRAHMRAPEYLPLILEPHSRFYSDPLIVLDFQSLYPSMIIAYNYCFSTCLGRVEHLGQSHPFEMGAWQLRVQRHLIEKLNQKQLIHISPCGVVFVKQSIREGVLPRMLREILDTRLMVKQSMKLHKDDKLLQRILHSRQLGLKLMANVTYGYTAANFSGRMPCVEVGDSVVSKGRETLERAIKLVETTERWGCRVVYGDTDSMFVLVPGRSREEAFRIGSEIAETVTNENPFPVQLKLEKVYHPSILQTKKRYVGYMYETAEQSAPTYEAKGIETVRRDGCPAVAKVLEKTLRILFETCDISAIKAYVCKQFVKVLSGRINVQDLIFAKEFRGVRGYKPGACVPALELTRAALQVDPRAEPRRGERVPYLVINGPPGVPLIRLVRSPHEYLANEALKINAIYYITKVLIPPLNRCLLLLGADANQWFADLPRKTQYMLSLDIAANILNQPKPSTGKYGMFMHGSSMTTTATTMKKSTISQYFSSTNCVCDCGGHTQDGICSACLQPHRRQQSVLILNDKCMQLERKLNLCLDVCSACCGQLIDNKCRSLDCSVLFMLNQYQRESKQIHFYRQLLRKHF